MGLSIYAKFLALVALGMALLHVFQDSSADIVLLTVIGAAFVVVLISLIRAGIKEHANRCQVAGLLGRGNTLEYVMGNIPACITVVSPGYEILWTNKQSEGLNGYRPDELVGQRCYRLLGQGELCPNCPVQKAIATKEVTRNIKSEKAKAGNQVVLEQTAIPVVNDEGHVMYVVEILLDATRKIELEKEKHELFIQTVGAMAGLIDKRDTATGKHSVGVRAIAMDIGEAMGLEKELLEALSIAALLHDIGKIGVPERILNKPGQLTEEEYAIIRQHSKIGYNTIRTVKPLLYIAEYILHHHERFDGKGYPNGAAGDAIPLVSKILCVADVWEAITSDRVYRPAMSLKQALAVMIEGRGTMFDPAVLDAFLQMQRDADPAVDEILNSWRPKVQ